MLLPLSLAFLSTTLIVVQAVDLYQGLRDANATKFAQWIQSDADLSAIFTNASVKTIFAPSDSAFNNVNTTLILTHFNPNLRYIIKIDLSNYALKGVLL